MRDTESTPFSPGDVVLVKTIREIPPLVPIRKAPMSFYSFLWLLRWSVWTPVPTTPGPRSGTSHGPLLRRIQQACPQKMLL